MAFYTDVSASRHRGHVGTRKFKIYDRTVVKTSLKIVSLSLTIFFVIMSICSTLES